MELDKRALDILKIIQTEGYEAYLVGGCCRDFLLNKQPKDYDISTNASYDVICKLFPNHKIIGKAFQVTQIEHGGLVVEIARFRNDFNHDGRNCEVDFNATFEDDLKRRDLTINTIAFDGINFIDLFNGISDLNNNIIKFVGNPEDRINEDYLRILRAIRIGFKCFDEPKFNQDTYITILENLHKIHNLSQERVTNELIGILEYIKPTEIYYDFIFSVLTEILGSKFNKTYNYNQNNPHHDLTLDRHIINVIYNCNSVKLKLVALLHDLGKPNTAMINYKTGFTRYIGHEIESVKIADKILTKLKIPNKLKYEVLEIVEFHMVRLSEVLEMTPNKKYKWVNKKVYQLKCNSFIELLDFAVADSKGKNKEKDILIEKLYVELTGYYEDIMNDTSKIKNVNDLNIDKTKIVEILGKDNIDKMKDLLDILCLWVIKTGKNNEVDILKRAREYKKTNA